MLGDLRQGLAEAEPIVVGDPWAGGQRYAEPPVDALRFFGEHHDRGAQRGQEARVVLHRRDLFLRAASEQVRAVPAGHEVELVLPKDGAQLSGPTRKLSSELDARIAGPAGLLETPLERDVVAQRLQVVVGPPDGIDSDPNGHASLPPAAGVVLPRMRGARLEPLAEPRPRGPGRPTRPRHP